MPWYVWLIDGVVLLTLFVVDTAICAALGYAAWKGKPKGFDRSLYALGFLLTIIAGPLLMVYAQRMQADVRTLQFAWQAVCFEIGALLFGVAEGCVAGVIFYRRRHS